MSLAVCTLKIRVPSIADRAHETSDILTLKEGQASTVVIGEGVVAKVRKGTEVCTNACNGDADIIAENLGVAKFDEVAPNAGVVADERRVTDEDGADIVAAACVNAEVIAA